MSLFSKKSFVWNEPWFFCQRMRDRSDWSRALLIGLATWILVSALLFSTGGANRQWWKILLWGMAAGVVAQLAMEASFMRREVSIDEKGIEAVNNAGKFSSYFNYPLDQIVAVQITRREEVGAPFSMLAIRTIKDRGLIGIPRTVRLEQLAQTLHRLNVPVMLSGWQPASDSLDQNEYLYCASEPTAWELVHVEPVPEDERHLMKLPEMILALLITYWMLVMWLGLFVLAGIYAYQQRQNVSFWIMACAGILLFSSLTIPFAYANVIGNYLAASYLIRVAKKRIPRRLAPLIRSFDQQVFAVELIQRETWNAPLPKVVDYGFITVQAERRRILYEGNLERWVMPFGSVRLCKVEEIQFGTGGESATGELRCFVVLIVQKELGPEEVGLRVADKEIGAESDTSRMRKAVELYEYLVDAIASEPQPVGSLHDNESRR